MTVTASDRVQVN